MWMAAFFNPAFAPHPDGFQFSGLPWIYPVWNWPPQG